MVKKKKSALQKVARKLIVETNPKEIVSEQFRTLRTNIKFSMPEHELKTLLITSSSPSEGKSTVSANIACLFAQEGKKVLLIDGDMRKPTVHYTFSLTNTTGLSNLLTIQSNVNNVIKPTDIKGLDIITSGPIPPNPAELLSSKTLDKTLDELKQVYDIIIFDAPPVLAVTDSQILADKCNGTVLVVDTGNTEKQAAVKAKDLLETSKAKILGVVLNNYKLEKDSHYYTYYGENK